MKEKKAAWHKTCINLIYTEVRIRKRPIFLHLIHFLNKRQDHRNGQSRFSPGVFGTRRSLIYGGSLHSGRAMCGEDQRAPRHLRTCRKNFISSPARARALRRAEDSVCLALYSRSPPRGFYLVFSTAFPHRRNRRIFHRAPTSLFRSSSAAIFLASPPSFSLWLSRLFFHILYTCSLPLVFRGWILARANTFFFSRVYIYSVRATRALSLSLSAHARTTAQALLYCYLNCDFVTGPWLCVECA